MSTETLTVPTCERCGGHTFTLEFSGDVTTSYEPNEFAIGRQLLFSQYDRRLEALYRPYCTACGEDYYGGWDWA